MPILTDWKLWASDVKLDLNFVTQSYQSWPCSSADFYWDTSPCVICLHTAALHKQTFLPAGWHPVLLTCEIILLLSKPHQPVLLLSLSTCVPPLTQGVMYWLLGDHHPWFTNSFGSLFSLFLCLSQICWVCLTVKNRIGGRKSEGCKSCWLHLLHGLEEVVVTPYCIQV